MRFSLRSMLLVMSLAALLCALLFATQSPPAWLVLSFWVLIAAAITNLLGVVAGWFVTHVFGRPRDGSLPWRLEEEIRVKPTREQLIANESRESQDAALLFFGKSREGALRGFASSQGFDLAVAMQHLSPSGFAYYFEAADEYLRSDASGEDCVFTSAFLQSMNEQLQAGGLGPETENRVRQVATYLSQQADKFDLDLDDPVEREKLSRCGVEQR